MKTMPTTKKNNYKFKIYNKRLLNNYKNNNYKIKIITIIKVKTMKMNFYIQFLELQTLNPIQ